MREMRILHRDLRMAISYPVAIPAPRPITGGENQHIVQIGCILWSNCYYWGGIRMLVFRYCDLFLFRSLLT